MKKENEPLVRPSLRHAWRARPQTTPLSMARSVQLLRCNTLLVVGVGLAACRLRLLAVIGRCCIPHFSEQNSNAG
jgi:hypothetical protein